NVASNDLDIFSIDASQGTLTGVSEATQFGYHGLPVSVAVHPTGTELYSVNQGDSTLRAWLLQKDGKTEMNPTVPLSPASGPTAGVVDPTGKFVYVTNGTTNNISAFSVGQNLSTRGELTAVSGSPFALAVGATTPAACVVHPSGKFLYTANYGSA